MVKEFSYQFHELEITLNNIAELMGFNENIIPDPFHELIEKTFKKAPEIFEIRAGYKYFDQIEVDAKDSKITINNQIFSPGKIITASLKNATSCALFLCTAGNKIEHESKKLSEKGDQIHSYIYDVLGSFVAEKTRIKLELEVKRNTSQNNSGISDSFSPGYCDWNIAEQEKLFSLLPDNFCGISLSKSNLMTPIKSVSGIVGIGKTLKQKGYQCNWCLDPNCLYGKINRQKKN